MALVGFPILLCPDIGKNETAKPFFSVAELYPTHSHSTSMGSFESSQHPNACILRASAVRGAEFTHSFPVLYSRWLFYTDSCLYRRALL